MQRPGVSAEIKCPSHAYAKESGNLYSASMLHLYRVVAAHGKQHFTSGQVCPPSNLNFEEWDDITYTEADQVTTTFLKYGFPTDY